MRNTENGDLAYRFEVEICGDVWGVKRTLALVNRIEGRFGALDPLARRLAQNAVEVRELAYLLETLIEDARMSVGKPSRTAIEQWVLSKGSAYVSKSLGYELLLIVSGNDVLQKVLDTKMGLGARKDGPVGPFVPTAVSSGVTG